MKVLLKDRCLVLVPENPDDETSLANWKATHHRHVLLVEENEGSGASLGDLGEHDEVCRVPINVVSTHPDGSVRLIGNFAVTPFDLDGRTYQTIEGFWQGLKFDDDRDRREIAALDGAAAKRRGDDRGYGTHVEYGGEAIPVGTSAHWDLMRRAVRAKFEQNPAAREALLSTGGRPLTHIVRHDSRTIPGVIMAEIWMQLRNKLRSTSAEGD